VSANKALEMGEQSFTTTLLVSPLKSQEQLKRSGEIFEKQHGVKFIAPDYRSGGGTQDQSRVTKEQQLYRQDYCGCIYALSQQRKQQDRLLDEMFSPISGITLPASIEERLEFYKHRMELEEKGVKYKILKQKFLNYRQLSARLIKGKNEVIASYVLSYSTLPRKKATGRIEFEHDNLFYLNRDEIILVTLEHFNKIARTDYKSLCELIYKPLDFNKELSVRRKLLNCEDDLLAELSPIVVVEKTEDCKYTLELDAKIYEDTKERFILL
jgi:hypothetical protein